MNHFINKCKICDDVISQCRCFDCRKPITYGTCEKCKDNVDEKICKNCSHYSINIYGGSCVHHPKVAMTLGLICPKPTDTCSNWQKKI